MKNIFEFLKETAGIPETLVTVFGLITLLLGNIKIYDLYTTTKLSYLITILLFAFLFGLILPRIHKLGRISYLGYRCPVYWNKLKTCIRNYNASSDDAEKERLNLEYLKIREILKELVAYYQNYLLADVSAQRPGSTRFSSVVVNNFEQCFYATSLRDWQNVCKRNLGTELDTFDNLTYLIRKASSAK